MKPGFICISSSTSIELRPRDNGDPGPSMWAQPLIRDSLSASELETRYNPDLDAQGGCNLGKHERPTFVL